LDILESAAIDANVDELSLLGLPEDVLKMAATHFEDLKRITRKLTNLISEKAILEQRKSETQSIQNARSLSNSILQLNKTIAAAQKEKIDWHGKMVLDVSHRTKTSATKSHCGWRRSLSKVLEIADKYLPRVKINLSLISSQLKENRTERGLLLCSITSPSNQT
jgi:hypothetical protein